MIAINDLNVSLDLDKAALEAVSGAGTHYSRWYSRTTRSVRRGSSQRLIRTGVRLHGIPHNMYKQVRFRTTVIRQRSYRYKYVG